MPIKEMKARLLQTADAFYRIPAPDRELFMKPWKLVKFSKGDYLIRKGRIENYFYYIDSGVTRALTLHGDQEISLGFSYNGDFSGAYDSFIDREPSWFSIQAVSNCATLRINYNEFMILFDESHAIERWGRIFTGQMLSRMVKRQLEARSFTAEEKLRRLEENSPGIFQLVPLKYLASYLGMTPETLSRLRARKNQ